MHNQSQQNAFLGFGFEEKKLEHINSPNDERLRSFGFDPHDFCEIKPNYFCPVLYEVMTEPAYVLGFKEVLARVEKHALLREGHTESKELRHPISRQEFDVVAVIVDEKLAQEIKGFVNQKIASFVRAITRVGHHLIRSRRMLAYLASVQLAVTASVLINPEFLALPNFNRRRRAAIIAGILKGLQPFNYVLDLSRLLSELFIYILNSEKTFLEHQADSKYGSSIVCIKYGSSMVYIKYGSSTIVYSSEDFEDFEDLEDSKPQAQALPSAESPPRTLSTVLQEVIRKTDHFVRFVYEITAIMVLLNLLMQVFSESPESAILILAAAMLMHKVTAPDSSATTLPSSRIHIPEAKPQHYSFIPRRGSGSLPLPPEVLELVRYTRGPT
jgi:hypothetical protein